jgi:hypothetical protein
MKTITINLPDELYDDLAASAGVQRKGVAQFAGMILAVALMNGEEYERVRPDVEAANPGL